MIRKKVAKYYTMSSVSNCVIIDDNLLLRQNLKTKKMNDLKHLLKDVKSQF